MLNVTVKYIIIITQYGRFAILLYYCVRRNKFHADYLFMSLDPASVAAQCIM